VTVPAPFVFDPAVKTHARTLERLETEQVAWLGTIGRDGYPHAVPIWFLWQDGRALIMSEPETAKVRNIRANDRVLLHLEAGADGEQLNVLRGVATLSPQPSTAWLPRIAAPYTAKYDAWLQRLNLTTETMAERYSVLIEVTPHKLIAW
jgi:PPOX class probable F420-dependent enzyme